jgi:hypothetical protein
MTETTGERAGELPSPTMTFVFEARVEVSQAIRVGGAGPDEVLWFVPITGGTVTGPRIVGEVLSGGGDWYVERSGVATLDAHYLLRTTDGVVIDIMNRGFWRASREVAVRLDAGENVDEREYYYRTSARFTTDHPDHIWLTQSIVVGMARQEGSTISIRFFAVD